MLPCEAEGTLRDDVGADASGAGVLCVNDGDGQLRWILSDGEAEEGDLEGGQDELVEEEADALLHPVEGLEHARRQLAAALGVQQQPLLHRPPPPLRLPTLLRLITLDRLEFLFGI